MPSEAARREMLEMAGTQFCPRVVAALMEVLDHDPEMRSTFGAESTEPRRLSHQPASV